MAGLFPWSTSEIRTHERKVELPKAPEVADRVLAEMRDKIKNGVYKVGEKLPPRSRLVELHQCSDSSIKRAQNVLEAEGILESKERSGVTVMRKTPRKPGKEKMSTSATVKIDTGIADEIRHARKAYDEGMAGMKDAMVTVLARGLGLPSAEVHEQWSAV